MAGWREIVVGDDAVKVEVEGRTEGKTKGKVEKIAGFETVEAFMKEMHERFNVGVSADSHNRTPADEDLKFVAGDQWDSVVKERRLKARKPVITVNKLVALVAQVVNNRLMNETEIRVQPEAGGFKAVARLREGLIRSIYKNSSADLARDEALKYQAICGIGWFCLGVDYAGDDVFDQELRVNAVADPFSVVLDPMSVEPSGGDAVWGFVCDDIPREDFKRKWKDMTPASVAGTEFGNSSQWYTQDTVRIASYWRMVVEGEKTLALMQDGRTLDVSDMDEAQWMGGVQVRGDGTPYVRVVPKKFARMYVCSGKDVLEGPYDYNISSLPIFRVPGWELRVGQRTERWGLVRFLKDPQRLHNYWRSVLAEQLVAAPRNKWVATREAVTGLEKEWRASNTSDDPLLIYNSDGTMPVYMQPPGIDGGLLNEANMASQDIRDVSNIHEASMGMQSNEVSGKAIQARQSISDVGTFIYHDRLRLADERCARLINEMIPDIYDAQRIVKVIGGDDKQVLEMINDPGSPESDITLGKYAVTVTTGPASVTKRAIAAEQMMAFVNAVPNVAAGVMDLIAEAQDWPKAEEFARRFRMSLPPGTIPETDLPPEVQQQMQQSQASAAQAAEIQRMRQEAEIGKLNAQAAEAEARAHQLMAMADKARSDATARMIDAESKADDREIRQSMETMGKVHAADQDEEKRGREADRHEEDISRYDADREDRINEMAIGHLMKQDQPQEEETYE
jgi:hypothetical protein